MPISKGTNSSQRGRAIAAPMLASASAFAILFTAAPVMAQTSGTNFDDDTIVVTARKREESLQDVPLAISAFDADDISKKGLQELEDVALLTPGLTFEDYSSGGFGTPIIRGAAQFSLDSLEQNVATFIDGVYIPRSYAVDAGTDSLERIEVVKGPQSALYGANAFIGAINYVTRKADLDKSYGDVKVTVGDDKRFDVSGSGSIPLVPGKLAIKVDAKHSQYDGDWENDHPAADTYEGQGTEGNLGGWNNQSYGLSVVAEPTDSVSFDFGYRNIQKDVESRAQTRLGAGTSDLNCGNAFFFNPANPKIFCGELPGTPVLPNSTGDLEETGFAVDPRSYAETETEILRAAVSIDLTDAISTSYQFANITAETFAPGNADRDALSGTLPFGSAAGSEANFFTVLPAGGFDYTSHELRLDYTSDGGIFVMVGGFRSDGEDRDEGQAGYAAPLYTQSIEPITASDITPNDNLIETETTAIFAQVDIPLIGDSLSLSAEGRYAWDEITGSDTTGEYVYDNSYFVPRVSLDYKLGANNLLYASAAKGVKSGGVNAAVVRPFVFFGPFNALTDEDRFFDDDENISYEIGSKNSFMDGRFLFNAAAYYIDWKNLQVSVTADDASVTATTALITDNLGSATSKGIEVDASFKVTDGITLDGGLALNDATYDDDVISQRIVRAGLCDDVVCASDGSVGGNKLPRSSDVQWNIGAQYDGSLSSDMEYFVRADLAGQSEQFVAELNLATIPSRALLNLRAGVTKGNVSADFWVTNATDEEYVSNAFYIPSPFFVDYVPTYGNKRRIGVTLGYTFD